MTHTNQIHAEATVQSEHADAYTPGCEPVQPLGAAMRQLKEQELGSIAGGPVVGNRNE